MHPEILEGPQESVLAALKRASLPAEFYLAGGTALALHLGHRRSVDLDFFSQGPFENEQVLSILRQIGDTTVRRSEPGTLRGEVGGVQLSFIRYDYPLLGDFARPEFGPPIAGICDIASRKLSAIMSRGTRRDFVDLHAVSRRGFTLAEIYGWFQQKYAGISYDPYHVARSLVYFVEAEEEPMPQMLDPVRWDDVTEFFLRESRRVFGG